MPTRKGRVPPSLSSRAKRKSKQPRIMLAKLKDRLTRQREKERGRERERLWQGLAYLPPCSAWGNQKWLTTTSVAASRKWRFVKYLFADRFYRLRCQRLPMSACLCSTLPLLSLSALPLSQSTSRLLFNEFRKFFDAASHACERRAQQLTSASSSSYSLPSSSLQLVSAYTMCK